MVFISPDVTQFLKLGEGENEGLRGGGVGLQSPQHPQICLLSEYSISISVNQSAYEDLTTHLYVDIMVLQVSLRDYLNSLSQQTITIRNVQNKVRRIY